jgi:hypothetical protein
MLTREYSTPTAKRQDVAPGAPVCEASTGHGAILRNAWGDWIAGYANWSAFHTLTFSQANRTHEVTRTEADYMARRLIQVLNRDLFGKRYVQRVGHSYFAYALGFERKPWGLLHMHMLTDRRTNWELENAVWRRMCGIVKIEPVTAQVGAARYVSKYATKNGDVMLFKPDHYKEPKFEPMWWKPLQPLRPQEPSSLDDYIMLRLPGQRHARTEA